MPTSILQHDYGNWQHGIGPVINVRTSANYRKNIIVPTSILQNDYGNWQHGIGPVINVRTSANYRKNGVQSSASPVILHHTAS